MGIYTLQSTHPIFILYSLHILYISSTVYTSSTYPLQSTYPLHILNSLHILYISSTVNISLHFLYSLHILYISSTVYISSIYPLGAQSQPSPESCHCHGLLGSD